MEPKQQKRVRVLDHPETFILINIDRDEAEAKVEWLAKYKTLNKPVSQSQVRRERQTIRGGKVMQRTKFR